MAPKVPSVLDTVPIGEWFNGHTRPFIIAGPCSAESREQVLDTAKALAGTGKVQLFRAGIWKPRTRPNTFEGVGVDGLKWLAEVKETTGLRTITEVANAAHVEACLEHGIDALWIGARTTPNPFSVQEIADALKGVDIPVLVKNPINPDIQLWVGALERISRAGVKRLAAIHRGFSWFDRTPFRNSPMWEFPIKLRQMFPDLDIVCDPSHIAGERSLISYVAQKAMDLNMSGLMIESHIDPANALSDAEQQLAPKDLQDLLEGLVIREPDAGDMAFRSTLEELRSIIDELDDEIIQKLSARFSIAEKIGEYKRDNNVTILQIERWEQIMRKQLELGDKMDLAEEFINDLMNAIHKESIRRQEGVMNRELADR